MGFLLDTTRPCGGEVGAAARAAPPRSPGREACLATRGFTLLELIAVIAIIAMLPAIVYPIYNRARESGRRALCMSNLKQLVAAVQMYAADNDGGIPIGPNAPEFLNGLLSDYGASGQVLVCPSDPGNPPNVQPGPCHTGGDTSYIYYANEQLIHRYGFRQPLRLESTSPLLMCVCHRPTLGTYSIARYDGSVRHEPERPPRPYLIVLGSHASGDRPLASGRATGALSLDGSWTGLSQARDSCCRPRIARRSPESEGGSG
jgi:prepilin-type N-terminal cleavage/methylation domain-containing protein